MPAPIMLETAIGARYRRYQRAAGLLILTTMGLLFVVLWMANRQLGLFSQTYALYGFLDNVRGLSRATPVTLAGLKIGEVRDLSITDYNRIRIELILDRKYQPRIRQNSTAEVKADLLARWKVEETTKKLSAMAADLVAKLDGGADIADLAKGVGVEAQALTINRNAGGAIGANGAAQAYAVAIGKAASASLDAGGRAVLKVTESKLAPLDPASGVALQIRKELSAQLGEDVLTQYVQRVQSVLGASINQRMLQMALGGGSGN